MNGKIRGREMKKTSGQGNNKTRTQIPDNFSRHNLWNPFPISLAHKKAEMGLRNGFVMPGFVFFFFLFSVSRLLAVKEKRKLLDFLSPKAVRDREH